MSWIHTDRTMHQGSDQHNILYWSGEIKDPVPIIPACYEGTIIHWPCNEGTGTSAADVSGNGFDGTLVGGSVTWSSSHPFGNEVSVVAVDDGIDGVDNATVSALNPFTVFCFARFGSVENTTRRMLDKWEAGNQEILFEIKDNTKVVNCGAHGNNASSTITVETTQFGGIGLCYDGTRYMNLMLFGSTETVDIGAAAAGNDGTAVFRYGRSAAGNDSAKDAKICHIFLLKNALTKNQLIGLHNLGVGS